MSFPFPDDKTAIARLDWCRSGSGDDYDALSCVLRARMCASHIQAAQDQKWSSATAPKFASLLSAPSVQAWATKDQKINGVCGLLSSEDRSKMLWDTVGRAREQTVYADITKR